MPLIDLRGDSTSASGPGQPPGGVGVLDQPNLVSAVIGGGQPNGFSPEN